MVIVSPLSRGNTVGTLDATVFREIRDSFSYVLNIPIYFKIFIIIKASSSQEKQVQVTWTVFVVCIKGLFKT